MTSSTESSPSRRERRKAETRRRLVESARELFATRGVEATRINEITEAADVGFGSFYNYFESKDDIAAAVAAEVVTELGEAIAAVTAQVPDPAEVVATAHRAVIANAVADPSLGWLLIRLELSHDVSLKALGPFALRDLQAGIAAGRFRVDDPATTLVSCGGALLAIVRTILLGRAGMDAATAAEHHATNVLRMLGLTLEDAREAATRPLPASLMIA